MAHPEGAAVKTALQAYEDAAVHVAFVAEDFLRGWVPKKKLREAVLEWLDAQRNKDAETAALLEKLGSRKVVP